MIKNVPFESFLKRFIHAVRESWHLMEPSLRRRFLAIVFLTVTVSIVIVAGTDRLVRIYYNSQQQFTIDHLVVEINSFVIYHLTDAASYLAKSPEIKAVVIGKTIPDNEHLLEILSTAKGVLEASIVYVMDADGTVVGCSPYGNGNTLTWNNYKFRPYFSEAIAGRKFTYPALGVTTEKRGIYFSNPIHSGTFDSPAGVLVVKSSMDFIDSYIQRFKKDQDIMLLSPDGIVFAATQPDWLFRAALPLSDERKSELVTSRQFHDQPLDPLPFQVDDSKIQFNEKRYIVQSQQLALQGWQVVTIRQLAYPYGIVSFLLFITVFAGMASALGFLYEHREKQLTREVRKGHEHRLKVEASRQETRRELETILATSLVGIIMVRNGIITSVNERMCTIFGYAKEEILGLDIRVLFADKYSFRKFFMSYIRLLAYRDLENIEYDLQKKDGTVIPCSLSGKAIEPNQLSQGIVWVVKDISNRKKAEAEIEHAKERAEEASRAKSEFLANMSHEIRTPMNGIIGMADLLVREEKDKNKREQLDLILASSRRLMKIINDILDFSKNEVERLELDLATFSIRQLLGEVASNFTVQALDKNLTLNFDVQDTVPDMIVGDENKLMQVMYNLVGNGLKFTGSGGVTVKVRMSAVFDTHKDTLLFEVIDTGIGIKPDQQNVIFDAFTQADSSHSRKYGGTGLGLPISKSIVHLMGGTLKVESVEGKGTRFWFYLPLLTGISSMHISDQETEISEDAIVTDLYGHILLVEDDLINRTLATMLLEGFGCSVKSVHNGNEAIEAWKEEKFDCILMDVQMPEMDGYETVRLIRKHESVAGGHIPVIAMTACVMDGDRQKCLNAGMDDYLPKPIDRLMLFAILDVYLPQKDEL